MYYFYIFLIKSTPLDFKHLCLPPQLIHLNGEKLKDDIDSILKIEDIYIYIYIYIGIIEKP